MEKKQFLRVHCPRCQYPHFLFSKSSYEVKCINCRYLLTKSTGGKTKIRAKVEAII